MFESLAGKLLIAGPNLIDPNFLHTVVLILEHDEIEGALGVVLNRPTDAAVAEYLPAWAGAAPPPATVFVGGPVTPEVALGIADTPGAPPADWEPAVGNVGLIDLSLLPDEVGGVLRVRVFAGYAGWVAGQLELELATQSWFVVDAEPGDAFTSEPEQLWRTVLSRQTGRLAWYAHYPIDIHTN